MYYSSDFTKKYYKTGEMAKILNVTPTTIMNYDRRGLIQMERGPSGRRMISRENLIEYLDSKGLIYKDNREKHDVIYVRVSSDEQKKKGDLDRQALFLIQNVQNLISPVILSEVGSGLNDKRAQLQKLITMVMNDEVNNVYVTYKDRLTRFGFHSIETVFNLKGVNIIVVKDTEKENTVNEELVEDMMALIASFSGKLYRLRSRKYKTNREGKTNGEPKDGK